MDNMVIGQVCEDMVWERNARYGIDSRARAENRQVCNQLGDALAVGGCAHNHLAFLCMCTMQHGLRSTVQPCSAQCGVEHPA